MIPIDTALGGNPVKRLIRPHDSAFHVEVAGCESLFKPLFHKVSVLRNNVG
jgi:hypothetical protein